MLSFRKFRGLLISQIIGIIVITIIWYLLFTYLIGPKLDASWTLTGDTSKYAKNTIGGVSGFLLFLLTNYLIMNAYINC